MTRESVGSSVVFINTDSAVFSKTSRRAARSHAASVSRQRGKSDESVNGESSRSDESTISDPAEHTFLLAIGESPGAITSPANPSPKTFLDTALLDPFATTALPMNQKMSGLIRGCKWYCSLHWRFLVTLGQITRYLTVIGFSAGKHLPVDSTREICPVF
jgi:hypothetical protein